MPNDTKQSRLKFFESHNKNKVIKMFRISLKDRQIQNKYINILRNRKAIIFGIKAAENFNE